VSKPPQIPRRSPPRAPVTEGGQRTRAALLAAGVAVAERHGLAGLSVNAVVEEAGLAKGTFYVHFAGREAFVDALHQRFYARVGEAVAAAAEGCAPGAARIVAGIDAYLDACLENRAIKALLLETRSETYLTSTIAERERLFARLIEPSARALGWPSPTIAARLFVSMTSEAALVELEAGRRVPAARALLHQLVARPPAAHSGPRRARRAG
jgi:AcrR family transcriptional regulator